MLYCTILSPNYTFYLTSNIQYFDKMKQKCVIQQLYYRLNNVHFNNNCRISETYYVIRQNTILAKLNCLLNVTRKVHVIF